MIQAVRNNLKLCLFCVLSLVTSLASASTLTLTGNLHFPALDGSAQDADGLSNGTFSVNGDLVVDGTIHCNDDAPLSPIANACPIRISVTGNMVLEGGSGIYAENRRSLGNGGNVRLDVGGDLTLLGPDGSLPGSVISASRTTSTPGNAGSLTVVVGGTVDLEAGSIFAASTQSGNAGAVSVTGDTMRVAGLIASGPSRTVLSTRFSGEALAGGIAGQNGGTVHLRALGSSTPGLRIETDGIVVSQGAGSGRLVLLEACGIEVRGLIASLSRNGGPSQVALRSGRGILVDGQDLGSTAPVGGRLGRIRADGTQLGAAGYLVDLFAQSDLQIFGPDPAATGLFAVTSSPGELPLRDAGGTITAISLAGALTATGNAFEAGRDSLGNRGGSIDLQAQGDVTLDDASVRAVGGFTGAGGHIDIRSFQGAVNWTFGRGDVRPTGTLVLLPSRRGTIQITGCSSVDITGSQFPVNGSPVAPFPGETEGVCAPASPSLPSGEPPLQTCITNQPPAPSGGPFSVPESSANGTVVGTVLANDPDAGQSHTFSITAGNTGGAFAIDNAGTITVANSAALDFETHPTFTLTIEVTDNGTPVLSGSTTVTINVQNVPEQPVANDEGTPASPYVETVGNTILEVTGAPGLAEPKITFAGNLLTNDMDPDGATAFVVTLESATAGAVVSLNPDGTFTYLPPPGFTGVDSFTYRITDPDGLFDTAMVYINVEHRVWYAKNDAAAAGLGRSTDPFDTLAEAEAASSEGDTIYLFEGDGTTLGQSDGITLKNGQRLLGEAVVLAAPATVNINGVDGPVLRSTTGNQPKIENDDTPNTAGEDNGVSVAATTGSLTGIEIRGLDIAGFDNAIDVTATGANDASAIIRENVISGAGLEGIDVNAGSTGMVTLVVDRTNIQNSGEDGMLAENNSGGAMSVSVTGSTFTDNRGDHFQISSPASATGTIDVTFSDNVLTTTAANDPNVVGGGITLSPSGSTDMTFTIDNNNIQQAFSGAINLNLGTASTAAASMIGTISDNTIGTAGDPDSGSESGTGISVISNGAGLTTVAISGNQVRQYANPYGILLNIKEGSSSMNATVTGNTVANPGSFAANGIRVDAGATTGDSGILCAAVTGNNVTGSGPGVNTDIRLRQRFNTTIKLPGYGGGNNDTAAVNSFVSTNNAGAGVTSSHNVSGGGGGFIGGGACPMP